MTNFQGDILIFQNKENDFDINFKNGQPDITESFDTSIMYAVFGDKDTWQNEIVQDENEKMISTFWPVISRATVSDETKNNGVQSLKNALQYLIKIDAASKINIIGEIFNVFTIIWSIEIIKPDNETLKYFINWEKGIININRN